MKTLIKIFTIAATPIATILMFRALVYTAGLVWDDSWGNFALFTAFVVGLCTPIVLFAWPEDI